MEVMRILLVDDHILFRKGIASLISSRQDMKIVGEAGDGLDYNAPPAPLSSAPRRNLHPR